MACEITVKLKNPMKSLIRVSGVFQKPVTASEDDPTVSHFVSSVITEFDDIFQKKIVTIKLIED